MAIPPRKERVDGMTDFERATLEMYERIETALKDRQPRFTRPPRPPPREGNYIYEIKKGA